MKPGCGDRLEWPYAEWSQVQANITERGLAKKITYKEKLLPPSMLAGRAGEGRK